ncbi:MAG: starvation-inducible DNA-binding protein [Paraglaciecola sp.]
MGIQVKLQFNFCQKEIYMTMIDIGINESNRLKIAEGLKGLLADSYTLYLQTHNFHWNVTGPHFRELHLMFEEQYTELAVAVDDIAERIRTLDVAAPGTYKEFAKLSSIKEVDGVPEASQMIDLLTKGHEQVVRTSREVLKLAQEAADESTAALVSDRMRLHEKTSWMLRATRK